MSHSENMKSFQEMLDKGTHCSQCVLSYWAQRLGIDDDFALHAASGLGMGINHGDSCGAVVSTALALGLVYDSSDTSASSADGKLAGRKVEDLVKEFEAAFVERNGSLLCRDLLSGGYDAADPNAAAPEGIDPWENCAKYCADAVELAEAYLTPERLQRYSSLAPSTDGGDWENLPSPLALAAGSGATGIALGVLATLVYTYEKRRAENEREMRKRS